MEWGKRACFWPRRVAEIFLFGCLSGRLGIRVETHSGAWESLDKKKIVCIKTPLRGLGPPGLYGRRLSHNWTKSRSALPRSHQPHDKLWPFDRCRRFEPLFVCRGGQWTARETRRVVLAYYEQWRQNLLDACDQRRMIAAAKNVIDANAVGRKRGLRPA